MTDEYSGRLREQVVIERAQRLPDDTGNSSISWSVLARGWAALVPIDQAPPLVGEGHVARAAFRVAMRDVVAAHLGDRLVWRGRFFRINRLGRDPRAPGEMTLEIEEAA